MRILGERTHFQADHSSTSYLFYSPQRLDETTHRLAASFSRRASVDVHTAAYTYNVEGYDLPETAEDSLLGGPFEVMVSESYDWWTLVFTVPYTPEALKQIAAFEAWGPNDTGIRVEQLSTGGKVKVTIVCHLAGGGAFMEMGRDPFKPFVPRLLALRDEVIAGHFSGLQLIASQFDPESWTEPAQASTAAAWLAENVEA